MPRVTRGHALRWAVAVLAAAIVAVPVTASIVRWLGLQRSSWMRITLRTPAPIPPALRVAYGDAGQTLPVMWDGLAPRTLLGVRADVPVRLLGIDTDRGVTPPWFLQTWASGWERQANPPALLVRDAGVFDIDGAFQRFALTFEPSRARVTVGWLDRYESVDLAAYPGQSHTVTLEAPTARRGWVLLPPIPIRRLGIRGEGLTGPVPLDEVRLQGAAPQAWTSDKALGAILPGGELVLEGLRPLNTVSALTVAGIWAVVSACGIGGLAMVAAAARRVQQTQRRYEVVDSAAGRWLRTRTAGWSLAAVVSAVLAITLAYHVSYAVSVPPQFTFDSLGYYAWGRNLLHSGSLSAVATCRTPGYPAAIAAVTLLAGDRILPLIVAQHAAFCVLGAVVVWFLYPRVSPLWAAIGGLLAGASPAMAISANAIWTEALFVPLATASLLVFLYAREPRAGLLGVAGLLAGAAALIRPNGVLVLVLMLSWLFLTWLCDRGAALVPLQLVGSGVVLVGAFAFTIAPWVLHFHRETGRWGLSEGNCTEQPETHPALPRGLQPTNIFQLAAFLNLTSQGDAAGALAITEPQRAFFNFFPAQHRARSVQFLPANLIYDDRYTGEVFREYVRAAWPTYVRQVRDAFTFNVAHVLPPRSAIFVYPDMADLLARARTRAAASAPGENPDTARVARSATLSWSDANVLLSAMIAAVPEHRALRGLHLRVTSAAMSLWGVSFALACAGAVLVLAVPGDRQAIVLAWHAISLAAAPAVLAMGVDRYAMVGEPALYVLAVLLLAFGLERRVRRRSPGGEAIPGGAVVA